MELTIVFPLITFPDIQAAAFSTARIRGTALHDRIVFTRTRTGKYAKFHVVTVAPRASLKILRLTLYDSDGTILAASNQPITFSSGTGVDLETGALSASGVGDFQCLGRASHRPRSGPRGGRPKPVGGPPPDLIPDPQAGLALFVDFEAIGAADITGPWSTNG